MSSPFLNLFSPEPEESHIPSIHTGNAAPANFRTRREGSASSEISIVPIKPASPIKATPGPSVATPHVSFASGEGETSRLSPSVAVVVPQRLPSLVLAPEAMDWCCSCLRFVGRQPEKVPRGFICEFGLNSSCKRCRSQTHQRCEGVCISV